MDSKQRWERVLNAVEAETRRAEALLDTIDGDRTDDSADTQQTLVSMAVPSDWLLPNAEPGLGSEIVDPVEAFNSHQPLELPPLDQMPPVPHELGERILTLRTRIMELQEELAQAMREWRPLSVPLPPAPRSRRPIYVDRQL